VSRFTTDLKITLLRGQFRSGRQLFRLDAPLVYESDLLGATITVPEGFVTDMASVPKWPLAWLLAGGTANEAAVVHDWAYTVHSVAGKPITRSQADALLREAIPASQDASAPAVLMWLAVRLGGWISWDADGPTQVPHVASVIDYAHPDGP
jgi:hypothetical protein